VPSTGLGVTEFDQAATIRDLYREHGIDPDLDAIAAADLVGDEQAQRLTKWRSPC
jgi:hypothetical protein